jgi:carbamoylphosphate synthase small subunit
MIMEIVNIEASAFMEMNNILFKIEKQLKGLNSSKSDLSEWLDNQEVCILMNISDRKLLSLRQKGLIPFSRIDRKIYYKKEDILNYMRRNLKTYTNNRNGTAGIE